MENKYDVIIGIDIGLKGGITFFDLDEKDHDGHGLLYVKPMPVLPGQTSKGKKKDFLNIDRLKFILETPQVHNEKVLVVFEDVHAFPEEGVISVGTLMWQKGVIQGMCSVLGYDVLPISAKAWQKSFNIVPPEDLKGKQNKAKRKKWIKEHSLSKARELFPDWENQITHDGISDAVLIGLYGMSVAIISGQ